MTTHYETLGVGENFTADELKKAYRRLASQHHPDKGGDTKRFQEIQTAYDTLSDPNRRQQYDMQRQGGGPGGVRFHWHTNDGNMPNDIGEIFRNFGFGFGGGDPFGQFRQQQPKRNKDLRIELPVTLASTLEEQRKTISVQTSNGHRETVEVNIPRGISNGNNIRYSGLGDNLFNTIPRGDLYVQISVLNDNNFAINGIDLYTKTSVNCFIATVGGKTNITTLDGKMYELTIPPGAQPGIKFRLSGQGLYEMNSSRRGDLFVELGVTVPQNLSPEQLETVRSLINKQ